MLESAHSFIHPPIYSEKLHWAPLCARKKGCFWHCPLLPSSPHSKLPWGLRERWRRASLGKFLSGPQNWAATAAKSLQSCLTLCDPIDGSPSGSRIPGILQARTLEGVAIAFSNAWKWKVKGKSLSRVRLLATPWTAAHQAPPSMGSARQEYWSGVPLPSPVCY